MAGTLLFTSSPGASGFASFTAVGTDSAGAAADPQRFGVRVVTLNSAPTFSAFDVEVEEDAGERTITFAHNVSGGGAGEEWQKLEWHFSFTNPGFFCTLNPKT